MTSRVPNETYRPGADVGSRDLAEVQRNAARLTSELYLRVPWLDGVLLVGIPDATTGRLSDGIAFVGGTPLQVKHKLNRAPRGFWVVRDYGANPAQLVEVVSDERTITLTATATCLVALWVW